MSTNQTQQAYDKWQAAKSPWYKQATPTSQAQERQAEQTFTDALRNPQSSVKFGGQPGAGLAAQAMAQPPKPLTPAVPTNSLVDAAGAGRGSVNPPLPSAAPSVTSNPLVAAAQQQSRQVMPGVYEHGRGNYSDDSSSFRPQNKLMAAAGLGSSQSPVGMSPQEAQRQGLIGERIGYNPASDQRLQAGQPSAQNMQAADQLAADQNLASIGRIANSGNVPATPSNPMMARVSATHSGNDWHARQALSRLKTAANGIYRTQSEKKLAEAAYMKGLLADQSAISGQDNLDVETMKANADLQREGMQQTGANYRTGLTETGADRRDGRRSLVDVMRLDMERETQGYTNRASAQQEQLRNTLIDPQSTPEQRSIAQRALAALMGKTAADRMQAVALPDTTTDTGQVVRGGQALVRIMEDGSVQQVPVGAMAAPQSAAQQGRYAVGTRSTVNGKVAEWDGARWVPK